MPSALQWSSFVNVLSRIRKQCRRKIIETPLRRCAELAVQTSGRKRRLPPIRVPPRRRRCRQRRHPLRDRALGRRPSAAAATSGRPWPPSNRASGSASADAHLSPDAVSAAPPYTPRTETGHTHTHTHRPAPPEHTKIWSAKGVRTRGGSKLHAWKQEGTGRRRIEKGIKEKFRESGKVRKESGVDIGTSVK